MLESKWVSSRAFFRELWDERNQGSSESWKEVVFRIVIYIFCFFVFEKVLFRATTIPFEKYYNRFIFWETITQNYLRTFLALFVVLVVIKFRTNFFRPWKDFISYRARIFVLAVIGLLAWQYSVYDYNYYFDNWHIWDRSLLIFLAFATLWRPIFSLAFLVVLLPIIGQFEVLSGFSLAVPFLLIRLVILFLVFLILAAVIKKFRYREFIFLVGCLIAAHYFASGIRKLTFDWVISDHINYILPNTYTNGWLSFMTKDWISNTTGLLESFNFPLRIFTLFVECGIVLFYFKEKFVRIFLISAVLFHIGITAYSGIFFWKWMTVVLMALFLFYNNKDADIRRLFGKKYFIISVVLIVGGQFWCKPVALTWSDVPFTYTYKFKAILDNGSTLELPPHYFAPFSYQFTLSNFNYLNKEKRLQVVWGAAGKANGKLYNSITSGEGLFEMEESSGIMNYTPKLEKTLEMLVQRFARDWNRKNRLKSDYLGLIQPPRLLMTYPKKEFYRPEEKIVAVEILEITTFYSEEKGYRELRKLEISNIPIALTP